MSTENTVSGVLALRKVLKVAESSGCFQELSGFFVPCSIKTVGDCLRGMLKWPKWCILVVYSGFSGFGQYCQNPYSPGQETTVWDTETRGSGLSETDWIR